MLEECSTESYRVPSDALVITSMHGHVTNYIQRQPAATSKEAFAKESGPIHLAAWIGVVKAVE